MRILINLNTLQTLLNTLQTLFNIKESYKNLLIESDADTSIARLTLFINYNSVVIFELPCDIIKIQGFTTSISLLQLQKYLNNYIKLVIKFSALPNNIIDLAIDINNDSITFTNVDYAFINNKSYDTQDKYINSLNNIKFNLYEDTPAHILNTKLQKEALISIKSWQDLVQTLKAYLCNTLNLKRELVDCYVEAMVTDSTENQRAYFAKPGIEFIKHPYCVISAR